MANKSTLKSFKSNADNVHNIVKNYPRAVRYGIKIEKSNPDPYNRITYMYDAEGMTPAKMDYNNGIFDYGSWEMYGLLKIINQ